MNGIQPFGRKPVFEKGKERMDELQRYLKYKVIFKIRLASIALILI